MASRRLQDPDHIKEEHKVYDNNGSLAVRFGKKILGLLSADLNSPVLILDFKRCPYHETPTVHRQLLRPGEEPLQCSRDPRRPVSQ